MAGWPFWAATSDERIEDAFDIAELQAGEHLIDLGCGDGRVLLRAAAFRDVRVTGIELDPELAATARALLAEHDVEGTVVEADFADEDLAAVGVELHDVDVLFAYLSPATLQRLRSKLAQSLRPGARMVTTGYAVPGWEPVAAADRCYLYRAPITELDVDRSQRGWDSAGVLVSLPPDAVSLVAVKLHASEGPVAVRVAAGSLAEAVTLRTGADQAAAGDEVVVDLRFDPRPAGTMLAGVVEAEGDAGPPFQVFVLMDARQPGLWGLSATGCDAVGAALASGDIDAVLVEAQASTQP